MAFANNFAKGAIGGATAGSVVPGWGTAIGGLAGGLLGGIGGMFDGPPEGQQQRDMLVGLAEEASNRGNPQQSAYSDFRGDQSDFIKRMKGIADGQGMSLANETMRQGIQQGTLNQSAMAAGARGNGALAARQGMNNSAGMAAQAIGQGQMARASEQAAANQQLGLSIYGARGQDEANNQFNSNLLLRGMAQNDQTRISALGGSIPAGQLAGQAPTAGDYVQGGLTGLGQTFTQAKGSQHSQTMALAGMTPEQRAWYQANS